MNKCKVYLNNNQEIKDHLRTCHDLGIKNKRSCLGSGAEEGKRSKKSVEKLLGLVEWTQALQVGGRR